jgi:putative transposase
VDALVGAGWGEHSTEWVKDRNGYRQRLWDTRVGSIDLAIPKLRQGSYFNVRDLRDTLPSNPHRRVK